MMRGKAATLVRIHHARRPLARIHPTVMIVRALLRWIASSTGLHSTVATTHPTTVMRMTAVTVRRIGIARTHVRSSCDTRMPHRGADWQNMLLRMIVRDRNQSTTSRAVQILR